MLGAVFLREARAAVPAAWSEATVRAALATVDHAITVGIVSAAAKELTQELLRIMLLQKLILASATLLALGLIAWGASAARISLSQELPRKTAAKPFSPGPTKSRDDRTAARSEFARHPGKVTFAGRVLGTGRTARARCEVYRTPLTGYYRRRPYHAARDCDDRTRRPLPFP